MAKYAKTMGGRIVESREAMGLTQKELAKLIGVSSAVMSHWELDENKPNAERIVQLCKALNITASYLLDYYGKETTKVTKQEETFLNKMRTLSDYDKETVNVLIDRLCERADSNIVEFPRRYIPYFDSVVSAGTGELVFNDIPSELIAIPDTEETKNAAFAVRVKGDSMTPTFHDGDKVMVEKSPSIEFGEIGIFIDPDSGEGFIKQFNGNRLVSHNKAYPDILPSEHTRLLGKVIGKVDEQQTVI